MAPIPDESKDNPADNDPDHAESEDLETPNHIIPPGPETSSDEDGYDSDEDGPVSQGYMLLSQDPEEELGAGDSLHPQPSPPPSALDGENLATDSMTEVQGAGIDLSEAVAQGKVHPVFAANFPGNKVPVHLQVPDPPKVKKEDVLWNQATPASARLQLDSVHLSKVKSAMAGFQLPVANIPDWAQQIPEDQWKQQLVDKLTSPAKIDRPTSRGKSKHVPDATDSSNGEAVKEQTDSDTSWPGTSGT